MICLRIVIDFRVGLVQVRLPFAKRFEHYRSDFVTKISTLLAFFCMTMTE